MSSWIKQIVRASPDRSDRSWTVATAAHLTPVLINYHSCLSSAVCLCNQPPEKNRFVSTAAEMSDPGSRPLDREYTHLMLSFKWQPPAKVHNPEVKGTAGPQY